MKRKNKQEKIDTVVKEYNHQYCDNCHHTLIFHITEDKKVCSWCHHINKNLTRGRFNYMMNKLLEKDMKVRRLDENGKDI